MEVTKFFREIIDADKEKVGKKAMSLAVLMSKGLNIPPGFAITNRALVRFLETTGLDSKIKKIRESGEDNKLISDLLKKTKFPEDLKDEIIEAYMSLSFDIRKADAASLLSSKEVLVAVRASPADDTHSLKTILNIKGTDRLINAIKECWESVLCTENLPNVGVVVQKMIESESSGIAYSVNPETGDKNIVIKACFGLGEAIPCVNPDIYVIDSDQLSIKDIKVGEKSFEFIHDKISNSTRKKPLHEKSTEQVLEDPTAIEIARLTKKISKIIEKEVKIEWAIYNNSIYVLQYKEIDLEDKPSAEEVVMEIEEPEEEKPEEIDIYEPDIEEDLAALEEIEQIEKYSEPIESTQSDEKEASPEESIEETIFTDYKTEQDPSSNLESLAGSIVVACLHEIKKKIKDIYGESIDQQSKEIRRIDEIAQRFLIDLIPPTPEEVKFCLETATDFLEKVH